MEFKITQDKKRRIEMEISENNHVESSTNMDLNNETIRSVGVVDKPVAKTVEEFFENSNTLSPKQDFLNIFIEDETTLTHAIKFLNIPAVESLIKIGADPNLPNKKGITPISAAAHKGNIYILKVLVIAGAQVNGLNSSGSTALIQASHFGHHDAVVYLLQNGASADFANLKGTTALMRASQEGHVEISKRLVASEADVNRKNHEGMNALMLASQRGHADMVRLLISAGAVTDEQTSQGSTALMLACKRGHEKCVEALVSLGAEIFMRDCRGRTARDTATKRNHIALLHWLDTQVQIQRIQEDMQVERTKLLFTLKDAFDHGQLRLISPEYRSQLMLNRMTKYHSNNNGNSPASSSISSLEGPFISSFPVAAATGSPVRGPDPSLHLGASTSPPTLFPPLPPLAAGEATSLSTPQVSYPSILKRPQPGYFEWQWPVLLHRAISLPFGVFALIESYVPLPRPWQWTLSRLKQRIRLNPHQAAIDLNHLLDQMVTDANVFGGSHQRGHLVRINKHFNEIVSWLSDGWGLPPVLVQQLGLWADLQSLLSRTSEIDLCIKASLVRKLYSVAISLFKWYRCRASAQKLHTLLSLPSTSEKSFAPVLLHQNFSQSGSLLPYLYSMSSERLSARLVLTNGWAAQGDDCEMDPLDATEGSDGEDALFTESDGPLQRLEEDSDSEGRARA